MPSKDLFDRIFSAMLLVLLSPVLLLIAIALKTGGGPVIFRQARLGHNAVVFNIYKFRTMIVDADRYFGADGHATINRITPV